MLCFSIAGTLLTTFITAGILVWAGDGALSLRLSWNEALAFSAILSATDASAAATIYSGLGADPGLVTLIAGEGSVNDAVSIVLVCVGGGGRAVVSMSVCSVFISPPPPPPVSNVCVLY